MLAGSGPPEHWRIALCDVGQGDMLVLRTADEAAVVVDAGEDPAAADACLRSLGVEEVEVLMISHDHRDHYGGTAGVLEGREAGMVLYSASEGWDPPLRRESAGERLSSSGLRRETRRTSERSIR